MKAKDPRAKAIFEVYPNATELYIDANGNIWTNKTTAELQSNGASIKTLHRTEFLTAKEKE